MGWVNDARRELLEGRPVAVRPSGGSMRGRIESGQLVTIEPASIESVGVGDVVFVEWKGNAILHLVLEKRADSVLIGNALGKVNGWAPALAILGRVAHVEAR